jgi:hypothetical protein
MKVIKLTTPWDLPYISQSPNGLGIWGDYQFEINNDCDEADYWFIWGWITPKKQTVRVPKGHLIYITDEAHNQRFYHPEYLKQFDLVSTPRKDITGINVIPYQEIAPWYLPATWDDLVDMPVPAKIPNGLSVISSTLTHLEGHLRRFALIHQVQGHFKDAISVYGRGIRPVADKREALFPYPYSLALENSAIDDYFTEKIREVFLGYGFPFYWGCPNLERDFDPNSCERIDVNDYKLSIDVIEHAIGNNYHEQRFEAIRGSRLKVLYEYHLFPALTKLAEMIPLSNNRIAQTITAEKNYWKTDETPSLRYIRKMRKLISLLNPLS